MELKPLPRAEWQVKLATAETVLVAMHANGGVLYWTKFALVDLPNDFVSKDDLERVFIDKVHVPTV